MADLEAVTENISELLTNTINMTSIFYDLFISDVPQDITLKQYGEDNKIITTTIPNRAKDRESMVTTGSGSPEGVVTGNIGAIYVDTSNSAAYIKAANSGLSTGWVTMSDQTSVETYIRNYLTTNKFVTEDDVNRYLVNNNYAKTSDITTAIDAYRPAITMTKLTTTTGSISLVDNEGFYVTPTGNITFVLPAVSNTSRLHSMMVQINITSDFISGGYTVNAGTNKYFDNIAPSFTTVGMYNLIYEYDLNQNEWVCGWMAKGVA